jgi:hypothetical protein
VEEAWLVVAHRILDRLDRACHQADLTQLNSYKEDEEQHAKLRAASVMPPRAFKPSQQFGGGGGFGGGGFGGGGGGAVSRGTKRPTRPTTTEGALFCEYHKNCGHTTEDCKFLKRQKTTGK